MALGLIRIWDNWKMYKFLYKTAKKVNKFKRWHDVRNITWISLLKKVFKKSISVFCLSPEHWENHSCGISTTWKSVDLAQLSWVNPATNVNSNDFSITHIAPNHNNSWLKVLYIVKRRPLNIQRKPQKSDDPLWATHGNSRKENLPFNKNSLLQF